MTEGDKAVVKNGEEGSNTVPRLANKVLSEIRDLGRNGSAKLLSHCVESVLPTLLVSVQSPTMTDQEKRVWITKAQAKFLDNGVSNPEAMGLARKYLKEGLNDDEFAILQSHMLFPDKNKAEHKEGFSLALRNLHGEKLSNTEQMRLNVLVYNTVKSRPETVTSDVEKTKFTEAQSAIADHKTWNKKIPDGLDPSLSEDMRNKFKAQRADLEAACVEILNKKTKRSSDENRTLLVIKDHPGNADEQEKWRNARQSLTFGKLPPKPGTAAAGGSSKPLGENPTPDENPKLDGNFKPPADPKEQYPGMYLAGRAVGWIATPEIAYDLVTAGYRTWKGVDWAPRNMSLYRALGSRLWNAIDQDRSKRKSIESVTVPLQAAINDGGSSPGSLNDILNKDEPASWTRAGQELRESLAAAKKRGLIIDNRATKAVEDRITKCTEYATHTAGSHGGRTPMMELTELHQLSYKPGRATSFPAVIASLAGAGAAVDAQANIMHPSAADRPAIVRPTADPVQERVSFEMQNYWNRVTEMVPDGARSALQANRAATATLMAAAQDQLRGNMHANTVAQIDQAITQTRGNGQLPSEMSHILSANTTAQRVEVAVPARSGESAALSQVERVGITVDSTGKVSAETTVFGRQVRTMEEGELQNRTTQDGVVEHLRAEEAKLKQLTSTPERDAALKNLREVNGELARTTDVHQRGAVFAREIKTGGRLQLLEGLEANGNKVLIVGALTAAAGHYFFSDNQAQAAPNRAQLTNDRPKAKKPE